MFLLLVADQQRTRQDPCAHRPHWLVPRTAPRTKAPRNSFIIFNSACMPVCQTKHHHHPSPQLHHHHTTPTQTSKPSPPNLQPPTTPLPTQNMTTDPIPPSKFASALLDLPLSTLHLKVLELRNSIAHLDYSNEQLQPFATPTDTAPDPVCVEAIAENCVVIARMQERIGLVRAEVERRGVEWVHFSSGEVEEEEVVKGEGEAGLSSAWTDGTFQTGVISGGELRMDGDNGTGGGTMDDGELRARMEALLREGEDAGADGEGEGVHL